MKITNPAQNYINPYANAAAKQAGTQAPQEARGKDEAVTDSINLSATTRDMQKISSAMETGPVERQKRVQDLKNQVQANQYTVNAEQVAEKMIGTLMDELG